ncbi:MAG: caspase family protein [Methylobacterium ajmalii]
MVVLIGTTRCPLDSTNLPDLPSVKNNIDDLASIFRNPDIIGIPEDNIKIIIDSPSNTNMLLKISEAAECATDTLFIYYAGHGIKTTESDGLFIVASDTTAKHCHLNGVEFGKIRRIIHQSPAAKKILIFDCCYSGEINSEEMGGSPSSIVSSNINIRGVYSIASAPRNRVAFAPKSERFTAFSKELITVLRDGIDDLVEYMTLDLVYEKVKSRVSENPNLPSPQKKVLLDVDEFVIARNINFSQSPFAQLRSLEMKYNRLKEIVSNRDIEHNSKTKELENRISMMQLNIDLLEELKISNENKIDNFEKEVNQQKSPTYYLNKAASTPEFINVIAIVKIFIIILAVSSSSTIIRKIMYANGGFVESHYAILGLTQLSINILLALIIAIKFRKLRIVTSKSKRRTSIVLICIYISTAFMSILPLTSKI